MGEHWQARSFNRMPDTEWRETVSRVRGEFKEMPCLRVTADQARVLFGLHEADGVLNSLQRDGFLDRTPQGEYVRRNTGH